ncbi:MAG TPA: hypothetical protein VEJ87_07420 [Acidimicrobiales bacterium]|nr:hypothetical protein [Acidimicrobiales bacterium]
MPPFGLGSLSALAASGSHVPLGGHLWHALAALGFLVVTLGGIWVSEVVQRRRRNETDRTDDLQERVMRSAQLPGPDAVAGDDAEPSLRQCGRRGELLGHGR